MTDNNPWFLNCDELTYKKYKISPALQKTYDKKW